MRKKDHLVNPKKGKTVLDIFGKKILPHPKGRKFPRSSFYNKLVAEGVLISVEKPQPVRRVIPSMPRAPKPMAAVLKTPGKEPETTEKKAETTLTPDQTPKPVEKKAEITPTPGKKTSKDSTSKNKTKKSNNQKQKKSNLTSTVKKN